MFVEEKRQGEVQAPAPVKPIDDVARDMLNAAQLIRQFGHTKDRLYVDYVAGPRSGMCIMGAFMAIPRKESLEVLAKRLHRHLVGRGVRMPKTPGSRGIDSVVAWNNAPERTADDVINALEAAANVA